MSSEISNKWLPLSQLSVGTSYSAEYLSLLARKGKLKARKFDNVWYSTKAIIDEYVAKHNSKPLRTNDPDELVPLAELAPLTSYSAEYLSLLARKHKFTARKFDNVWYATRTDINAYVRKQDTKTFTPPVIVVPEKKLFLHDVRRKGETLLLKAPEVKGLAPRSYPVHAELIAEVLRPAPPHRFARTILPLTAALSFVLAVGTGFSVLERTSPLTARQIQGQAVALATSPEIASILDAFRALRDIAFGTSRTDTQPIVFPRGAIPAPLAITDTTPSLDASALKSELQASLESYVRTQLSSLASPEPRIIYQTTSPTINTTVIREEILLADTRPTVTRQSTSDVDLFSRVVGRLTDGGSFANPTISGGSISGASISGGTISGISISTPSADLTDLLFTNATGTNATTTNLYVSGRASTTELRANTGVIGSLTSVFGTLTNLLVNGSTTLQNFSAQYASTTQIGSTGNAYFATAGGSVGIGTTNPSAKLQVTGTAGALSLYVKGGDNTLDSGLTVENADGDTTIRLWVDGDGIATIGRGAGRSLNIDSSGNVGVGIVDARAPLEVQGTGTDHGAVTGGPSGNYLAQGYFSNSGAGGLTLGGMNSASGSSYGVISGFATGDGLLFNTRVAGAEVARMTILNGGNVGIGTTNPGTKLQISESASSAGLTDVLTLSNTRAYAAGERNGASILFTGSSGDLFGRIGATNGEPQSSLTGRLSLFSGTGEDTLTETLTLFNGLVGIGTTVPGGILDIHTGLSESGQIRLSNSTSDYHTITTHFNGADATSNYINFKVQSSSGNLASTMLLRGDGRIGIGTTTPRGLLGLNDPAGTDPFVVGSATPKFIIKDSGNVGIGTANPEALLSLEKSGSGTVGGVLSIKNSAALASSNSSQIAFSNEANATFAGTAHTRLKSTITNVVNSAASFGIDTYNGTSEGTRFYIKEDGNVGIGTTNPESILHVVKSASGAIGAALVLDNQSTSALNGGTELTFLNETGGTYAGTAHSRIRSFITNAGNGASAITFRTWNGSAEDERVRIDATGNVGIGTTNPGAKLEIATGAAGSPWNVILNNTAAGGIPWYVSSSATDWSSGGSKFLISRTGTASGADLTIDGGGNVGIGTVNPSTKLEVSGGFLVTGSTTLQALSSVNSTTTNATTTNLYVSGRASTTELHANTAYFGNVGVGTTNPAVLLSIHKNSVGTGTTEGAALINSTDATSNAQQNSPSLRLTGKFWHTGGASWFSDWIVRGVAVAGEGAGNNYLDFSSGAAATSGAEYTNRFAITDGGFVGIGTTAPGAKLEIRANTSSDQLRVGTVDGNYYKIGRNTDTGFLDFNGIQGGFIGYTFSGGNVGIGTTNPSTKLEVSGGFLVTGSTTLQALSSVNSTTTNATTTNLYVSGLASTTDLRANTALFGGRVGIGSTTPSTLFVVSGTSTLQDILPGGTMTNNTSIYDIGSSTARWNSVWAKTLNVGTSTWSLNNGSNGRLSFFNAANGGGTETLSLLSGGNVGIGTTNPSSKLHVRTATDQNLWVRSSADAGTGIGFASLNDTGAAFAEMEFKASKFWFTGGGNVGIGGTSPDYALDVNGGTIRVKNAEAGGSGTLRLGENTSGNGSSQVLFLGSNSVINWKISQNDNVSGALEFIPSTAAGGSTWSTSPSMMISNAGNVGIGTTNPLQKLHVSDGGGNTSLGATQILVGSAANVNQFAGIGFGWQGSTNAAASVGLLATDASGSVKGDLIFNTRDVTTDTAPTQRMIITSSGNVGIGTTNPGAQLYISGAGQNTTSFNTSGNKGGTLWLNDTLGSVNSGGTVVFGSGELGFAAIKGLFTNGVGNGIGDLMFSTRNATGDSTLAERMRITNGGDVGIGDGFTANPLGTLEVSDTTDVNTPLIYIGGNAAATTGASYGARLASKIYSTSGTGTITDAYGLKLDLSTDDSSLAFNTTNLYHLSVTDVVTPGSDTVTNQYGLYVDTLDDATNNWSVYTGTAKSYFGGNVGIGTTNPGNPLVVQKNQDTATTLQLINDNNTSLADAELRISVGGSSANDPFMMFGINNAVRAYAMGIDNSDSDKFKISTAAASATNLTSGTPLFTIDTSGNVGIGTAGPTAKFEVSGGVLWHNSSAGGIYVGLNSGITPTPANGIVQAETGFLTMSGGGSVLRAPNRSTGSGTTAVWDADGDLIALSSSLRYKEHVNEFAPSDDALEAFLALSPKNWDYTGQETGAVGFISEDLAALPIANEYGLSPLVNYDNEGRPDSNRDFAVIALQHLVLQKLDALVEEITAITGIFRENLIAWMGDAANGIQDFFAERVKTKELCISDESGETCITRGQLDQLLASAGGSPSAPSSGSGGGSVIGEIEIISPSEETASSTPETVAEEPAPEPVPEPLPEPLPEPETSPLEETTVETVEPATEG